MRAGRLLDRTVPGCKPYYGALGAVGWSGVGAQQIEQGTVLLWHAGDLFKRIRRRRPSSALGRTTQGGAACLCASNPGQAAGPVPRVRSEHKGAGCRAQRRSKRLPDGLGAGRRKFGGGWPRVRRPRFGRLRMRRLLRDRLAGVRA